MADIDSKGMDFATSQGQEAVEGSDTNAPNTSVGSDTEESKSAVSPPRTLHWRNFEAALKEITPSSSESLGSLADLRKWNEEFGEGRKEKRKQSWGKGRFGFSERPLGGTVEEGKVAATPASASKTSNEI